MPGSLPHLVHDAILAYAAIGGIVALAFLLIGLERVDPAAAGAYAFRPLLVPGLVLLWPVVIIRWVRLVGRVCSLFLFLSIAEIALGHVAPHTADNQDPCDLI